VNLPASLDAERAVLGAVIIEGAGGFRKLSLRAGDFYVEHNRDVFTAAQRLDGRGDPIDLLTITEELRRMGALDRLGGQGYVALLVEQASILVNLPSYEKIVVEEATRRAYLALGERLRYGAANGTSTADLATMTESALAEHQRATRHRRPASAPIAEILATNPEDLQTRYIVPRWIPAAAIGILAAKPGAGKGKLVQDLCIARATGGTWLGMAVAPGPALFWSGEQGKREDFRVTQALCRGRGLTADAFPHHFEVIYDPELRFGSPAMVEMVTARLAQSPGLLIGVDSLRRAFDGDESDSAAADAFYRTVLVPLRKAGATVLLLAHPPKTTGTMKLIADENMIRGSGDWVGQIDSFLVLRPLGRARHDAESETITMRLVHVKPRSGPQAEPLLVSLHVTADETPLVAFDLSAKVVPEASAEELAGAVRAVVDYMAQTRRAGRAGIRKAFDGKYGRPTIDAAIRQAVAIGTLIGPLGKTLKRKGERGDWYLFVDPSPAASEPGEDDELPF
jgi:AAA domain/DnaB-like helicase N terminal domain